MTDEPALVGDLYAKLYRVRPDLADRQAAELAAITPPPGVGPVTAEVGAGDHESSVLATATIETPDLVTISLLARALKAVHWRITEG
jgi:hypothetical protein